MAARPGGTVSDTHINAHFKRVHTRLEELSKAQLRMESMLVDIWRGSHEMAQSSVPSLTLPHAISFESASDKKLSLPGVDKRASEASMSTVLWAQSKMRPERSMPTTTSTQAPTSRARSFRLRQDSGESLTTQVDLQPRPEAVWLGSETQTRSSLLRRRLGRAMYTEDAGNQGRSVSEFGGSWRCMLPQLPIHPHSKLRLTMDVLSMMILLYDSMSLPLILAFSIPMTGTLLFVAWASATFWSLDLLLNFVSAYYKKDVLIQDLRTVILHYMATWFLIDLAVVGCDWFSIALEVASGGTNQGALLLRAARVLKLGRIVRILAVLRCGRFAQVYQFILLFAFRQGRASHVEYGMRISKLVLLTLWFNHVGACIWRGLGLYPELFDDTGDGWKYQFSAGLPESYFYFLGFYWSTAALFSGSSMTMPTNSFEAILSVIFIIFGVMFASSLISTLAALLIDVHMNERENTEQMRTLRRFLKQHKISLTLSVSIQKQVFERMQVEPRLSDQDVRVLNLLSANLRAELRHALCDYLLLSQDTLRVIADVDSLFIHELLKSDAVLIQAISPGEEIFSPGENYTSANIVAWGDLRYTSWSRTLMQGIVVQQQTWICEIAIFAEWTTQGLLEATTACELITLNALDLYRLIARNYFVATLVRDSCSLYCRIAKELHSDVGDLQSLHMDVVMYSLPRESRNAIASPALASLQSWRTIPLPATFARATEEEEKGLCMLRSDGGGWLVKVEQVVRLRLEREDGTIFVRLVGNAMDANAGAQLPSIRCQLGELPLEALDRLIKRDLPELQELMKVTKTQVNIRSNQWTVNKVRLKQIKIEFQAQVDMDTDSPLGTPQGTSTTPKSRNIFMESSAVAEFLEGASSRPRLRPSGGGGGSTPGAGGVPPNLGRMESPFSPRHYASGAITPGPGNFGWISSTLLEKVENNQTSMRKSTYGNIGSGNHTQEFTQEGLNQSSKTTSISEEPQSDVVILDPAPIAMQAMTSV